MIIRLSVSQNTTQASLVNTFDQQLLQDPARPVDQLLRWHFRQAVLANMRGAGEPIFEFDFPPGTDMMGEILGGPEGSRKDRVRVVLSVANIKY